MMTQLIWNSISRINIYPEFFYYPWLVSKGMLPYRDFFDHHGFILYYILAPFSFNKPLSFLVFFHYLLLLINFILFISIVKRTGSIIGFVFGILIYSGLIYFAADSTLWFEQIITTIYLSIYFLTTTREFRFKNILIGILVFAVSLIKPTAGLLIIPVFFIRSNVLLIAIPILGWIMVSIFFAFQNGLRQMFESFFVFNGKLPGYFFAHYNVLGDKKFLAMSGIVFLTAVLIPKKNNYRTHLFSILFCIFSLQFLLTGYARPHLMPVFTFVSILIVQALHAVKDRFRKLFIVTLIIYSLLLVREIKFQVLSGRRQIYSDDKISSSVVNFFRNKKINNKSLYILSNRPEIYYQLDVLPPTKYSLVFPFLQLFEKNMEPTIISELRESKTRYVVIPRRKDENYSKLIRLFSYIETNYNFAASASGFTVLEKKH